MYNHILGKYQEDNQGVFLLCDIEAAAQARRDGEIYEIAFAEIGGPFRMETYINPEGYKGKEGFSRSEGAVRFLTRTHGPDYFPSLVQNGLQPLNAILHIRDTLFRLSQQRDNKPLVMISQGSDYDFPLLGNLFAAFGEQTPWHYRNVRDLRTLSALFPIVKPYRTFKDHTAKGDVQGMLSKVQVMAQTHPAFDEYLGYPNIEVLQWD